MNGEFYQGGTFLPNTKLGKMSKPSRRTGTGKQEIEPYKWEIAPEGMKSVYKQFNGVFGSVVNGVAVLRTDDCLQDTINYYGTTLNDAQKLITMYNNGVRWM